MTHITSGQTAPNFSLSTSSGVENSLRAAMKKGPVLLAFFKVSCPVCQYTFPFVERLHQRYSASATVLGISQDDAKATNKFAKEYGATFPILLDEGGYPVSNVYGLTNVPTLFLIDSEGNILTVGNGFDRAAMEQIAAQLAATQHSTLEPLFRKDEAVPDLRPG